MRKKLQILISTLFIGLSAFAQVPKADLLDVVFNADGSATDVSVMRNTVQTVGSPTVVKSSRYGINEACFKDATPSAAAQNYYKIDYSSNEDFKAALESGHTLEALVRFNLNENDYESVVDAGKEVKPFSSHQGGGTGLMICKTNRGIEGNSKQEITFLPHVGGAYQYAHSGIVPKHGVYYHLVGVWDKEAGEARIYIDGKLMYTNPQATGDLKHSSLQWFAIGGDPGSSGCETAFSGDVAIARIYSDVLTSEQVAALYSEVEAIDTKAEEHNDMKDVGLSKDDAGYYLIGSAQDLVTCMNLVNSGDFAKSNFRLTADIDLSAEEYNHTMIGSSANPFAGHFDGQDHTVTVNYTTTADYGGFFSQINGATIENLKVAGQATVPNIHFGALCGWAHGNNTITRVITDVDITGTRSGVTGDGGMFGRSSDGTTTFTNCAVYGTMGNPGSSMYCGFVAFDASNTTTNFVNCYVATTMVEGTGTDYCFTYSRTNGQVNVINSYYLNPMGTVQGTGATAEDFASGMVCFLLNGDQSDIAWYQTLGQDEMPTLSSTSKRVYAEGTLRCDGEILPDAPLTYSNEVTSVNIPDHQYSDGVCTVCGKNDPSAVQMSADGYYEVGSELQYRWIANKVNAGEGDIKIRLTADIDLSDEEFNTIMIGLANAPFKGEFDGAGHTVTVNFTTTANYWGMFSYISGATIHDLVVEGTAVIEHIHFGGLAGNASGNNTIYNVVTNVDITGTRMGVTGDGGMFGYTSNGTNNFNNCAVLGDMGYLGSSMYCGFVACDAASSVTNINNCFVMSQLKPDTGLSYCYTFSRNNGKVNVTNSYFLNPIGTVQGVQVTEEQMKGGELCVMLNKGQQSTGWYQTLGEDAYPVPFSTSLPVYSIGSILMNVDSDASYSEFQGKVIAAEQEYCENVVAQQALVSDYQQGIETLSDAKNIDELLTAYENLKPMLDKVRSSEAAYAAFVAKVEETKQYLAEHQDFENELRDALVDYLNEAYEPTEEDPFGSVAYILEVCELSNEQLAAECTRIDMMLEKAIAYDPSVGTDITMLLVNPGFDNGFKGWEGTLATGYGKDGINAVAEALNKKMDMHQTLTGLKNGIYELQVNGAFRPTPYDYYYNTNYAAMLYANGNYNYFQANIEDMISKEDAQDGVNCNINGAVPDFVVTDIEGNEIGYIPQGLLGCYNAFQAGRYKNSILCNVTDGTLTVGISQPGTYVGKDWLGFGNIKLIYYGEMDEATESLDRVLQSMSDRAGTILNTYKYSEGSDYNLYPNFSQALKDALASTVGKVAQTTDAAGKYALVQQFSDLFQQVYECKMAYIALMDKAEQIGDLEGQLISLIDEKDIQFLEDLYWECSTAYIDGTVSAEEALAMDPMSKVDLFPKQDENGVYQLNNERDFCLFGHMVNGSQRDINAVLNADLNMEKYSEAFRPIGFENHGYLGTFDGQGHKISNLTIDGHGEYFAGLFGMAGHGAVIKNLIMDETCAIINGSNACAMVAGNERTDQCLITLSGLGFEGSVQSTGRYVGAIAGINYGYKAQYVIENCYSRGTVAGTVDVGQISGHLGSNSIVRNCWSTAVVTRGDGTQPFVDVADATCTLSNNYTIGGTANAKAITEEQLASGELCFLLNGDQSSIAWTQTIGQDAAPVPGNSRGIVYVTGRQHCDGTPYEDVAVTYTNQEGALTRDEHQCQDGYCTVCGQIAPEAYETDADGFYALDTPSMYAWFSKLVAAGYNTVNARLTADIDLTSDEFNTIMIGTATSPFSGTFDGQDHRVTVNFTTTADYSGMFSQISGATIQNLTVDGTATVANIHFGGLCGWAKGNNTITRVISDVDIKGIRNGVTGDGGMFGRSSDGTTTFTNCAVTGTLGNPGSSMYCGFVAFDASNTTTNFVNCYVATTMVEGTGTDYCFTYSRTNGQVNVINSYYLNPLGTVQGEQMSEEQFAGGEVCYLLNGDQSQCAWYQSLGQDRLPVLAPSHGVVTRNDDGTYGNITAVQEIAADQPSSEQDRIYNLMGQKVQRAQRGIFIIGGKKVYVK